MNGLSQSASDSMEPVARSNARCGARSKPFLMVSERMVLILGWQHTLGSHPIASTGDGQRFHICFPVRSRSVTDAIPFKLFAGKLCQLGLATPAFCLILRSVAFIASRSKAGR